MTCILNFIILKPDDDRLITYLIGCSIRKIDITFSFFGLMTILKTIKKKSVLVLIKILADRMNQ